MALPFFQQGAFAIDPNATPDQIAQKRAYIAAMMPRFGSAKFVGEGVGQLATGVVIGRQNRKLNEAEGAGRKSAADQFARLFGTANSAQSPEVQGPMSVLGMTPQGGQQGDPNSPLALAGDTMAALGKDSGTSGYRESLIGTESGGNWAAQNSETGAGGKKGHFGRVQFGQARLQEAMDAGAIPQGTTPEQFMASPALQIAAENWHFGDLESKLGDLVGAEVNGQPLDMGALVAMGHLGGAGGARKFVESGGAYNPSDSFGTSLAEYAATHGGQGGAAPAPTSAPSIPINELYMALQNPWMSAEEKGLITSMIGEQQQASDPLRQLELRKAEIELAQLENPTQQPPEDFATRMFTLNALQIDPQSEEGKVYLMTGKLPEPPEPGYRAVTPEEAAARLPKGADPNEYQVSPEGKIEKIGGGGVTVNNSIDGGGKFEEAFAKGDAATVETVYNSGLAAQRNLGRIDQLGALLDANPTGAGAAITQFAGSLGIPIEGLDEIQAAQALINSLVPEQRQPGSGPMSDADLALFKQSLPQIINSPGGNKIIVGTMRAIAEYDAEGARIVQRLRSGEITRSQAFDALQNRPNPLEGFKPAAKAAAPGGTAAPSTSAPDGVEQEVWDALTPEERALWD